MSYRSVNGDSSIYMGNFVMILIQGSGSEAVIMAWTDEGNGSVNERDLTAENGSLEGGQPSTSSRSSPVNTSPLKSIFHGKDALSFANILRSRNKFVDALEIYESLLEKDSGNVEAHIGKGICLQMQNMGRLAFESFTEAIRLDPHNPCALTHCGILYKEEGRLVEAAEVCFLHCYYCYHIIFLFYTLISDRFFLFVIFFSGLNIS